MRNFPLVILALLLTVPSVFGVTLTFGTINGGQSSTNNTGMSTSPTVSGQVFNTLGALFANSLLTKDVWAEGGLNPYGNGVSGFPNDDPFNYYVKMGIAFAPDPNLGGDVQFDPTYIQFVDPTSQVQAFTNEVRFTILGKHSASVNFIAGVIAIAKDIHGNIIDTFYVPPVDTGVSTSIDYNVVLSSSLYNIARVEFSQNWDQYPVFAQTGVDGDGNPIFGDIGQRAYKAAHPNGNIYLTPFFLDNLKTGDMIVPEPSTFVMAAGALLGLVVARRRRSRNVA